MFLVFPLAFPIVVLVASRPGNNVTSGGFSFDSSFTNPSGGPEDMDE